MIIGSGLLARSFAEQNYSMQNDVCIYAAGVSNSSCKDTNEFAREKLRLTRTVESASNVEAFVYFSTCSVYDPDAYATAYVQHKLAMEYLVAQHPKSLILRLPQVAGMTPNPHTLLNYLFSHISRSESFTLWRFARRNIIDVKDVTAIGAYLINNPNARKVTINVANTASYTMTEIVQTMEELLGKSAIYNVIDRGSSYSVDTSAILNALDATNVEFGNNYLSNVIKKYYGSIYY